ncbi:NAD-dependent epimerase/dehydratase family protein [Cyanobium sp. LEGE 06113]|uniref:NAD-dependent epimerase/dehydratase family protein n=1 Tax=Cyanobium sp. LEGE 06113 TaxID=1297573 RepID=UPI001D13A6F7|nr:NAD-dependent epimerase/dehydratase family protein [Cyanobium sp. LEGE 06113]
MDRGSLVGSPQRQSGVRISIIGCGWLGTALAGVWQARGQHELLVTTTRPERLAELQALGLQARLLRGGDTAAMADALAEAEVVLLTLAPGGDRQVDADAYASTYLPTCRSLLELLPQLPLLRQIIYTSSCGVYGDAGGDWIDESTPPQPRDDHAAVLLQAEALLGQAAQPVALLRLGALHGPGRELAPRLARLAGSRRPGDGSTWSNWIHRDDAVVAIDRVLESGFSGTLNVVDGQPVTLRQLMDRVCSSQGLEPVQWTGGSEQTPAANRRIRNTGLLALGVPKPRNVAGPTAQA